MTYPFSINLTLIVQTLVFVVLIGFTMKFVWPKILRPMEERARRIAEGLSAAEEGERTLAQAQEKAQAVVREARERATQIIDQAQHRANEMIEQAKAAATSEGQRLVAESQEQIQLEAAHARESLRREVPKWAVQAASKLLGRDIDPHAHGDLLERISAS